MNACNIVAREREKEMVSQTNFGSHQFMSAEKRRRTFSDSITLSWASVSQLFVWRHRGRSERLNPALRLTLNFDALFALWWQPATARGVLRVCVHPLCHESEEPLIWILWILAAEISRGLWNDFPKNDLVTRGEKKSCKIILKFCKFQFLRNCNDFFFLLLKFSASRAAKVC